MIIFLFLLVSELQAAGNQTSLPDQNPINQMHLDYTIDDKSVVGATAEDRKKSEEFALRLHRDQVVEKLKSFGCLDVKGIDGGSCVESLTDSEKRVCTYIIESSNCNVTAKDEKCEEPFNFDSSPLNKKGNRSICKRMTELDFQRGSAPKKKAKK